MKKFLRRMSGIVLAIVMAFTMLPSLPTVAAAAGSFDKQTITMHFKPASQWDKVYTYIKQGKNWDTIPEYSYIGDWPGAEIEKDSQNDGWYSFTIIMSKNELHCKFTNNKGIETKNDVGFTPDKEITEKWVTMSSNDQDAVVSDTKPSGWVDSVSNPPVKPVVKGESPKLNADKTVTFNLDATGDYKDETDVRLMGTVPGTNWDDGLQMEKKGDFFTVTTGKLEPGIYQYKFLIDKNGKNSWITDPANSEIKDGNSKLVVPGLESKTLTVTEGAALELPDKLNLYKADGTEEQVSVTYKLKDKNDKVTLKDNSLEVAKKSGIKEVKLVATAGSETSEITAKVVAEQYTYNIYFYDSNAAHMDVNAADVHMWEIGGPDIEPASFTEKVKLDDGNEWLKASITTDLKNIGMIPRSKGGWSWQTDNHTFNNADAKKSVDLYIVYGDKNTYTELPAIKEQRERKVIVEYERQNNDYDG